MARDVGITTIIVWLSFAPRMCAGSPMWRRVPSRRAQEVFQPRMHAINPEIKTKLRQKQLAGALRHPIHQRRVGEYLMERRRQSLRLVGGNKADRIRIPKQFRHPANARNDNRKTQAQTFGNDTWSGIT